MAVVVQSVRFNKGIFNLREAERLAEDMAFDARWRGMRANEYPEGQSSHQWRLRQWHPDLFEPHSFRTVRLRTGIEAVIGRMKPALRRTRAYSNLIELQDAGATLA